MPNKCVREGIAHILNGPHTIGPQPPLAHACNNTLGTLVLYYDNEESCSTYNTAIVK